MTGTPHKPSLLHGSLLAAALVLSLAACGRQDAPASAAPLARSLSSGADACSALYSSLPAAPVVQDDIDFATARALILSFVDKNGSARAVDYITARQVDYATARQVDYTTSYPGITVGELSTLPVVVVAVPLVSKALVTDLVRDLAPLGLVSVYQDAPLSFFLAESVSLVKADTSRLQYGLSGKGVGVAIIDSGLDATHPDLPYGSTVVKNVKVVGSVADSLAGGIYLDAANTDLSSGHGTHVAGIVAASGSASGGKYRGVAPGARLVGIGTGEAITILYALEGLDYALRDDVRLKYNLRVINNSWGANGGDFEPYNPVNLATKRAHDLGVAVVFAAGNNGPEAGTLNPYSASPCVLSVAAGDKAGNLSAYSSRGVSGDSLLHPDVTAPGDKITSTRSLTGLLTAPTGGSAYYTSLSGSSMAAPHVAGTLALMFEANPSLTPGQAFTAIEKSATPLVQPSWEAGAGYLDALGSVRRVRR
jgi:serine protease AprX